MRIDRLVVFTAVSWLGLWVHELFRVPSLVGFTPDGDIFMLLIASGLAYWWYRTRAFAAALALVVYGLVNLVGGAISVLPFDLVPFKPEQTTLHYSVHVVYAVCQLPLIWFAASALSRRTLAPPR